MERLTYKFNSLSLAKFAANTIKKDGVGVVLSNNNGFIMVETADAASVQEIANSARGYEVLREATPTMSQQKPVGMVRPANPVVARLVNYKVPMFLVKQYPALKKKKDSMPGSRIMWSHTSGDNDLDVISAKEVDSYLKDGWVIIEQLGNGEWQVETLTEKKKLTPDQLKKVHTGVAAQMQAKKGAKKEEIEEEEVEESEEFFEDGDNINEAKPLIGGQKKLDVNKNDKLDAQDFKLLRAKKTKKEEVEVNEAAPGAAPTIKAGMRLYAKQDKKTDNGSVVKGQYYKVAAAGNGLFDLIHQSVGYRKAMHKVTASAIQAMIQNKVF
jgi:hypothetical protein